MEPARIVAWSMQMRRAHLRLADALARARISVESGTPAAPTLDPLTACWAFCAALDGHHCGEDAALFPALRAARPELGPLLDELTRDHRMIADLLDALGRDLTAGAPPAELLRHLDGIEAVITTHFRWEEKRLLGVIDDLGLPDVDPAVMLGPLG